MTPTTALTAAEISAMPAGREMDRLVAEWVMCLRPCDWHSSETGVCFVPQQQATGAPHAYAVCPPYSTDIAAAWAVVEKLHFNALYHWKQRGEWNATFITDAPVPHGGGDSKTVVLGNAKTIPLALCRGALLAVISH